MNEFMMASGACVLAGIMTTFHPCPLTTNIASVSMLIGWSAMGRKRGLTLLLFILGYLFTYLIVAMLLSSGALSVPSISFLLQITVNSFIGPALILVGMLLADLMNLNRIYRHRSR